MAYSETFHCSNCGIQKKQFNHWVLGVEHGQSLCFYPWEDVLAKMEHVITLCGEGCATKVLSRQVAAWRAQ